MDEDIKTLLAILALVYGSSNGLGLLKTAMDPVEEKSSDLKDAMESLTADSTYKAKRAKKLFWTLWSPRVLVYIVIVIVVPVFLAVVVKRGPLQALAWIGLGTTAVAPLGSGPVRFYWILLLLSLVATVHYLSAYLKGWGRLIKYWMKK